MWSGCLPSAVMRVWGKFRPYVHNVGTAPPGGLCSTDIVVLNARMPK